MYKVIFFSLRFLSCGSGECHCLDIGSESAHLVFFLKSPSLSDPPPLLHLSQWNQQGVMNRETIKEQAAECPWIESMTRTTKSC